MRDIDRYLHDQIHESMMQQDPAAIFGPRIEVFSVFESVAGTRISGKVLDVGCGNGYASIWLAKNRDISTAVALEASERAVSELLPRNIRAHSVVERVEPKLGSFDDISEKDEFDHVVAFGALHHSRCLYSTMRSIFIALKPGGFLIAQEPVMPNTTTHAQYLAKYDVIEERFGIQIRNGDRDDHFFREAEYVASAVMSGFDLVFYDDFRPRHGNAGRKSLFQKASATLQQGGVPALWTATMRRASRVRHKPTTNLPSAKRKILIFRKPERENIPHLWPTTRPIGRNAGATTSATDHDANTWVDTVCSWTAPDQPTSSPP